MNKFLRKFDTIRFVAPWSIFKNFLRIFHFFEFKFEFWIWAGLVPVQTGTGPDRFDRTLVGRALLLLVVPGSSPLKARTEHVACLPFFLSENGPQRKRKPRRDFVAKQEFTFHTAATQVNKRPQGRDILQEFPWNFSRTSNSMKRQGQLQIIQQPSPSSNQFLAPHVWKQNSLQKPDGDGASLDFSISLSGRIN